MDSISFRDSLPWLTRRILSKRWVIFFFCFRWSNNPSPIFRFYINHDLVRISKLEPHLRTIRHFLELAPKEIVIVDFHRFPYPTAFNNSTHRKLIEIVQRELGSFALPPSGLQVGKGPTLNEIWQYNKSLIICYGQRQIAKGNS